MAMPYDHAGVVSVAAATGRAVDESAVGDATSEGRRSSERRVTHACICMRAP